MWRHNGAMTTTSKPAMVRDLDRINLRLPAETFAMIDAARADRLGNVSRNTWITEAIAEKLARETSANDRHREGQVANG
jgi:metal-responsive CopG/Arc/MetJ family transcriptional regulator